MTMSSGTEITHPTYTDGTDIRIGDHVTDTHAGLTGQVWSLSTHGATLWVTRATHMDGTPDGLHYFSVSADLVKSTP